MKKRLEATHFIEVYGNYFGQTKNSPMFRIENMDKFLAKTRALITLSTVAVWKIKAKEVAHV
jgi:hypothetical protein